jgi:hypothetical protein
MRPQSGRLLSLMNPTGNLNNESFHYANGKMRIQRLCPEELHLKMDGNRHSGDRLSQVIPDLAGGFESYYPPDLFSNSGSI